jgi:hypothetical protein
VNTAHRWGISTNRGQAEVRPTPLLRALTAEARESMGRQYRIRVGWAPEEFADLVAHVIAIPMLDGETIRLDGANPAASPVIVSVLPERWRGGSHPSVTDRTTEAAYVSCR